MPDPNSLLTRLRRHVARFIEPNPDAGEAWCVDCAVNDGRTLIVSADGCRDHIDQHEPGSGPVRMQAAWPGGVPGAP